MFESTVMPVLQNDAALAATVSVYDNAPAIFSENAPGNAKWPYIVFRIARSSDDYAAIQKFDINVDYYDWDKSQSMSRVAAERVEFLLDRQRFEHDRYGRIRVFLTSGGTVIETDPRTVHYNLAFSARAGRKKWLKSFTTQED